MAPGSLAPWVDMHQDRTGAKGGKLGPSRSDAMTHESLKIIREEHATLAAMLRPCP